MTRLFAWLAICAVATVDTAAAQPLRSEERSSAVVYVVTDPGSIDRFEARPETVRRMVDSLMVAATGQSNVADAWRSLVSPDDTVGIKVSTAGGRLFSTHTAVVDAIADGLRKAGVDPQHIVVWDRDGAALEEAGFRTGSRYVVRATEPVTGYDRDLQVSSPLLGKLIWGDVDFITRSVDPFGKPYETEQLSTVSYLSRVLKDVTKVINVPVMSTTSSVGVGGCLYNMTVRNVDNWRRFTSPPAYGDPYIAEMYADERIGGKVIFNIMDGLIAQYAGGPAFSPLYSVHHRSLYASKDPVALDTIALLELDEWRKGVKLPPISERSEFLKTAELYKLGIFTPEKIELKGVGR